MFLPYDPNTPPLKPLNRYEERVAASTFVSPEAIDRCNKELRAIYPCGNPRLLRWLIECGMVMQNFSLGLLFVINVPRSTVEFSQAGGSAWNMLYIFGALLPQILVLVWSSPAVVRRHAMLKGTATMQYGIYRDTMEYMRQELVLRVDLMRRMDEKLNNLKKMYRAESDKDLHGRVPTHHRVGNTPKHPRSRQRHNSASALHLLFEHWDLDGSGTLSKEELRAGFNQFGPENGPNISDRELNHLFRAVDRELTGCITIANLETMLRETKRTVEKDNRALHGDDDTKDEYDDATEESLGRDEDGVARVGGGEGVHGWIPHTPGGGVEGGVREGKADLRRRATSDWTSVDTSVSGEHGLGLDDDDDDCNGDNGVGMSVLLNVQQGSLLGGSEGSEQQQITTIELVGGEARGEREV
jgi:hypothetical protein